LVRFEDGKLNPKATFTALCQFLDLPYTESMTYCSDAGKKDPHAEDPNWYTGFELTGVYKTYDEFAGDAERYYLEYFMRNAYEAYGYDFHYYDRAPMDMDKVKELSEHMTIQERLERESWLRRLDDLTPPREGESQEQREASLQTQVDELIQGMADNLLESTEIILRSLRFVGHSGQPLRMMPKLQLDPDLLEQPLYH
jgi:hypothetical protein